jgi:hypothetical protein
LIRSPSRKTRSPSPCPAKSYSAVTKANWELGMRGGGGGGGFFFCAIEARIPDEDARDVEDGWRSRVK